jgi:flagellar motor switch protein FliG
MQAETVRRIAALDQIQPEILSSTERVLAKKLAAMAADGRSSGGVGKVVGILNLVPRATEKRVIETMEKLDAPLAEEVKRNMFVFEDIAILEDESIEAVVGRADERDLLLALKPVPEALRERIFAAMGRALGAEAGKRLRAEYAGIGRVRLAEADAAGQRVVALIRGLEEEGRIFVGREGEDA